MFQKKIDKLFSGMTNVFSIANDIVIAGLVLMSKAQAMM